MPSKLNRWLAIGGMTGTFLFIPIAFLIGEIREEYDHLSQGISALSKTGAPDPWAQTANFITAMFILPRRLIEHKEWQDLAPSSRLFGIVTTVLMVSYLLAQEGAVQTWHPWTGLLQRGMVATVMAWLFLLALRLFQTSGVMD